MGLLQLIFSENLSVVDPKSDTGEIMKRWLKKLIWVSETEGILYVPVNYQFQL